MVITANHDAELKRQARELDMSCLLKPLKSLWLRMLLTRLLEERSA